MKSTVRRLPVLLSLTLIAFGSGLAGAEDMVLYATQGYLDGLRTKETMHVIDTNKDGTVSKEEWSVYQERVFAALDKNHDGFLEPDEFFRTANDNVIPFTTLGYAHGLMTQPMFGKIDANGDGKISKEEFVNFQLKLFEMMDTDKKQELTVSEFIVPSHH
jgi:Ca2+-binding EF-hand superfamily protein